MVLLTKKKCTGVSFDKSNNLISPSIQTDIILVTYENGEKSRNVSVFVEVTA